MYERRVRKRRTATLTDEEWLQLSERGKLPRPERIHVDGARYPPADVSELVFLRKLSDLRWRVEQLCMALQKPSTSPKTNGSSSAGVHPGQLLTPFSELWEFLTATQYADGTSRIPGTLSLKCTSEGLQGTLTDPTSASYCCRTGNSLDDVFLALELLLKDGTASWRSSGYAKQKK